jgi:hypothetical protein
MVPETTDPRPPTSDSSAKRHAKIDGRPPYRLLRIKPSDRDFSEKPRSQEFSRQPIESKRESENGFQLEEEIRGKSLLSDSELGIGHSTSIDSGD